MNAFSKIGATASALCLSATLLISCGGKDHPGYEYAPDMYHSVPVEAYSQIERNKINPQGMNMRVPAAGTIARGKMDYISRISPDSAEIAGRLLKNPYAPTEANLAEGKLLYARFCQHCHGETGDGQGLVGAKFKGVPSYAAGRVASLPAGHIYHVIEYGRGRMMPHGSQVSPDERWKITLYVQQLQKGGAVQAADTTATSEAASAANPVNAGAGEATVITEVNPVTGYMYNRTQK